MPSTPTLTEATTAVRPLTKERSRLKPVSNVSDQRRIPDAMLFLTLGEVLALMGTVLTGLFGLIGCCRGFGRLLHAQETLLLVSSRGHLFSQLLH